jgi:hypothetical protein
LYLFSVKNILQLRHFQEETPGENAEGVIDLSPGWSEAEPLVLNISIAARSERAAEDSERVSRHLTVVVECRDEPRCFVRFAAKISYFLASSEYLQALGKRDPGSLASVQSFHGLEGYAPS